MYFIFSFMMDMLVVRIKAGIQWRILSATCSCDGLLVERPRYPRTALLRVSVGVGSAIKSDLQHLCFLDGPPHRGTEDAEIKDPSVESQELKGSPFKAWSGSEYSHACFTYCHEFLPWTNFFLLLHPPSLFPKPLPSLFCLFCLFACLLFFVVVVAGVCVCVCVCLGGFCFRCDWRRFLFRHAE